MSTSGGSGYCDCGDKEAWKTHPVCDKHNPAKADEVKGGWGASETQFDNISFRKSLAFLTMLKND